MAADLPPMTLQEAQAVFDRPGIVRPASGERGAPADVLQSRNEAQRARAQALTDTALSLGLKAGLSHQLRNIDRAVAKMDRDLDLIYDFTPLMIHQRVVPAVITEARDLYNQDGDRALRLSGAFYTIKQQARFASVAPNWREYLAFPKTTVDRGSLRMMLKPVTEEERQIWRTAVQSGWEQGVEQANLMLEQAMDRLNRDFSGMGRFHRFVIEGKMSMPAIAREDFAVTQQGGTLAVDETLLRITTLPEFNAKLGNWNGLIATPPAAPAPPPPPPPPAPAPLSGPVGEPYASVAPAAADAAQ